MTDIILILSYTPKVDINAYATLVPYGKVVRPLIARLTWTDPVLQMGDADVLSTMY